MDFTQKIYYNDKPIVLCADTEAFILNHPEAQHFKIIEGYTDERLFEALMELEMPQPLGIIFKDNAPQMSFKQIQNLFGLVAAGGGLVSNEHNDLLMIFRRGKWDLPKGKLDKDETIEDCALRELSEETGLSQLTLGEKLCETYHIYDEKGKKRIKYTTWFKMLHTARENLVAQTEEDIEEVLWVNTSNLAPFMSNTYSAIKDVLITAGMRW